MESKTCNQNSTMQKTIQLFLSVRRIGIGFIDYTASLAEPLPPLFSNTKKNKK